MLDPAATAATSFATAMRSAASSMSSAATGTFTTLHTTRDDLVARAPGVLSDYQDAVDADATASANLGALFDGDPATSGDSALLLSASALATSNLASAENAMNALNEDIEQFRLDVIAAEQALADEISLITGGEDVYGAHGREVRDPQTSWGISEPIYPGGPTMTSPLAEHLGVEMSDAVLDRVDWLSTADPREVEDWVTAHPDFAGSVGFVEPSRAAALYEHLASRSERGPTGSGDEGWVTGPLAQLFVMAPFAVGNLNGPKAADRAEFNKETLKQLLKRDDLTKEQREQLKQLDNVLEDKSDRNQQPQLLCLFLDMKDSSPRASVGFGDVDTADQVTTMTHGINTDMSNVKDWGQTASEIQTTLQTELADRGTSATSATVLFLEWDSGDLWSVRNIERADAGAERLAQLQRGFEVSNPDAQRNLALHSLGTTMGLQMVADNPGLAQNVWLYGSAGTTAAASEEIARQIEAGQVTVHATHASEDGIAPLGRSDVPVEISGPPEHSVDPRTIDGVEEFSAEGGWVAGFGSGAGEYGERVQGHNAQHSTAFLDMYKGFDRVPSQTDPHSYLMFTESSVGYLDPLSESYKHTVVGLADSLVGPEHTP